MPITGTLAMVAAAAMAGVPLLNGFLSKEMFFAESLRVEGPVQALDRALPFIATLWGMFSVAYSLRFIHGVFFGPPPAGLARTPHEPPRWMRLIELVLACLAVILPALTIGLFLDVGVRALLGRDTPAYSLALWHGFSRPVVMSLVALAAAQCFTRCCKAPRRGADATPLLPRIDAAACSTACWSCCDGGRAPSKSCSAPSGCSRSSAWPWRPRSLPRCGRSTSAGCKPARCPGRASILRSALAWAVERPARSARRGRRSSIAWLR